MPFNEREKKFVLDVQAEAQKLKKNLPHEKIRDLGRTMYEMVSSTRFYFFCIPITLVTDVNLKRLHSNNELLIILDCIINLSQTNYDNFASYEHALLALLNNLKLLASHCHPDKKADCHLFFADIHHRLKQFKREHDKEKSSTESKSTDEPTISIYIYYAPTNNSYLIVSPNAEAIKPTFIAANKFRNEINPAIMKIHMKDSNFAEQEMGYKYLFNPDQIDRVKKLLTQDSKVEEEDRYARNTR